MSTKIHNTILFIAYAMAIATLLCLLCSVFEPLILATIFIIGAVVNLVTLVILVYLYE